MIASVGAVRLCLGDCSLLYQRPTGASDWYCESTSTQTIDDIIGANRMETSS
jgi:hypothetical protein